MARIKFLLVCLLCLMAGGCASTHELTNDPRDPWERFNRGVFAFNDGLDRAILKPAAKGYRAISPEFVETGVNNFFSNLEDFIVALNNFLQFKFGDGVSDVGRIGINSTIGLLGFIDVASHIGLEKHDEDFGQTLGYWGVGTGPFIMLPFLGPSNLRDGPSIIANSAIHPVYKPWPWLVELNDKELIALLGLDIVRKRTNLLYVEEKTEEISRDRYVFIRDAFIDNREFLVNDGNLTLDENLYDELEEEE